MLEISCRGSFYHVGIIHISKVGFAVGNLQIIAFTKQIFMVANTSDSDEISNAVPFHPSLHCLLVSKM